MFWAGSSTPCVLHPLSLPPQLKDEEEEEEARLVEGKEDALRRLKQKITSDKEQEERKLRKAAEKSSQDLVEKLEQEKVCSLIHWPIYCMTLYVYIYVHVCM